jgi:hypothetical protein
MFLFEHDLRANAFRVCREGKPVPTFPDHALRAADVAADRRCELFFWRPEQLAGRSIDEVKPAASLADRGFVAAVRIVRRGIVRQPVLHVHPGPRTFEDDIAHNAYLASGAVLRLDPCQCQSVQPVQAGLRPDG